MILYFFLEKDMHSDVLFMRPDPECERQIERTADALCLTMEDD